MNIFSGSKNEYKIVIDLPIDAAAWTVYPVSSKEEIRQAFNNTWRTQTKVALNQLLLLFTIKLN